MTIWFQGTVTDAGPGAGYTADLELHPNPGSARTTTVPSHWRRSRLTGSAERRQSGRVGRYRLENAFRYIVARA